MTKYTRRGITMRYRRIIVKDIWIWGRKGCLWEVWFR